jgi:two-component system, OmpR family, alkaline phosphatase synthesis response regulator PhoP
MIRKMNEMPFKILLVDDEPDIIELLTYNFKKKGFEVNHAFNGVEGLKMAQSEHPDIIIIDIMMPEMDGIQMCKELRLLDGFKETRIIFLSATSDVQKVIEAIGAGGNHYVSKPIHLNVLINMVTGFSEINRKIREIN